MNTWQKLGLAVVCSVGVGVGIGAGMAYAVPQPRMRAALEHLQRAKTELTAAEADKGGYRVKALADLEVVITDVQSGVAEGNDGPRR